MTTQGPQVPRDPQAAGLRSILLKRKPRPDIDPKYRNASQVTDFQLKLKQAQIRPIYVCPLPSTIFRVAPLAWLGKQAMAKGAPLGECEFFAVLKRNKRWMVDYVVFGLFHKGEVVVSGKDWPENVLTYMPSMDQQLDMAKEEMGRFPRPNKWATEATVMRMLEAGVATWGTDGMVRYKDFSIGIAHDIVEDHLYNQNHKFSHHTPVIYPQKAD